MIQRGFPGAFNAVLFTYSYVNRKTGELCVTHERSCIDCLHESNNHEDEETWLMEFEELDQDIDENGHPWPRCDYCAEVIE